MVYKTFKINSNKISANNSLSLKEELKDLIPYSKFEGHYGGKVDGLEDTIGVFLIPLIYFPASSRDQISIFKDMDGFLDVKIKKSDIESYFKQVSDLEDIFESDLTVGTYVENRNWLLQEDKCEFLGISDSRIDIEILINDTPVNVYFRTDVYIRIFKKEDVMEHLEELSKTPKELIHLEIDRTTFKVKDKFGDLMTYNSLNWPEFYMEFADKLLEYKDNRTELIQKIQNVFNKIDITLPKLESDSRGNKIDPTDIDPFTIFALFNKQIKVEKSLKIIKGLKEEFSIKSDIPNNFIGIPTASNMAAAFYLFGPKRGKDDIDNLWNVFEHSLRFSEDFDEESKNNLIFYYNKVLNQDRVKWNITMGLYWIRPFVFVSLDYNNRVAFSNPNVLSQNVSNEINSLKYDPPKGEQYLRICDYVYEAIKESKKYNSLVELSHYSYINNGGKNPGEGIGDENIETVNYWIYAPGEQAFKWDEFYNESIMAIGWDIGDLRNFKSKKEFNNQLKIHYNDNKNHFNDALCLWQFTNEVQVGDIIFAKKGVNEIIGRGVVESSYEYDSSRDHFTSIRKVNWTDKGSWTYGDESRKLPMKTLTNITNYQDTVKEINSLFGEEEYVYETPEVSYPSYDENDFLEEVYVTKEDYNVLKDLLINKKNLIVQGAPGVGKTFMAKRLAYSIMGVKDMDRVMMVQFHQSYSYEDFVMGYRPSKDGFQLREGSFYKFCKKAEDDDENDYFFIIDEINRGNLSKIFGELFMLIENDKRGEKNKIQLLYSDELFYIPKNVHIIGLMNTADRSLAMIDYALRRRFAFFDLKPGFSSNGFNTYQFEIDYPNFDKVINVMEELNIAIKEDETLGEGFRIGHSYFCNLNQEDVEEKLNYIVEYEIIPLLKEYWFDEPTKVEEWSEKLRNYLNE